MKIFHLHLLIGSLLLLFNTSYAQQTPAPNQTRGVLITGATIHVGDGTVIENGSIAFEKGSIIAVGRELPAGLSNYQRIDASGKHIYPGLIAANTQLGLREIDAVRATRDDQEVGDYNPNVRALIAYNTDSDVTPTVRSNGMLLAQVTPQGGRISGQSSIVELDGWNWEDAVFRADDGIHVNWPRRWTRTGWWAEPGGVKKNEKYAEEVRNLKAFISEARAYTETDEPETPNLRFEAMRRVFTSDANVYVHVDLAKDISEAILFFQNFDIIPVIIGGRDSWMVTDLLRQYEVPVILRATQSLPATEDDHIDQPFKTPAQLQDAGVLFGFSGEGAWEQRNTVFQAGQAVPYGLSTEAALSGLTLNLAKIFKIDDRVGTLAVGKDATLLISEGDILDMRTSKVTEAFIQGKKIDLDNKQKSLYRKYQQKYEEQN